MGNDWRRWFIRSFVVKENALYPDMNWGLDWGGGYAVIQLCNVLFALIISRWLEYSAWIDMLSIFALLALLTGLAALIGYRIERRRFPMGRPLIWKDQDTLTLLRVFFTSTRPIWESYIKIPLPTLRRVTFMTPSEWGVIFDYSIRFTFSDGTEDKLVILPANARLAMIDFLRRKLPPSVAVKDDESALR
ncbi:MAG: hypothetical protein LBI48_01050 [Burkholderiaceae bacterium]|nr:hypothetical protein [Burkholderiaceae bacterium]